VHQSDPDLLLTMISRRDLIACLASDPGTKPELVSACDLSRSTVNRGINHLERAQVVTRGPDGRYRLTLFGEVITHELDQTLDRLNTLEAVRAALTELGAAVDLDPAILADAAITPIEGLGVVETLGVFGDATRVRLVNPPLPFVSFGLETMASMGLTGTVYLEATVFDELSTAKPALIESLADSGLTIQALQAPAAVAMAIVDRAEAPSSLVILLGSPSTDAIVESRASAAIEWGDARLEAMVAEATPVL